MHSRSDVGTRDVGSFLRRLSSEMCLTVSADIGKNGYKGGTIPGGCAVITAGCTAVAKQGFAQSDLATLTVEYDEGDLAIGEQAFKALDLTVRLACETGCGTCTGANDCSCTTRPLALDSEWLKNVGSVTFEAVCAPGSLSALPPSPPSTSQPPSPPPLAPPPLAPRAVSCSSPGAACLTLTDDSILASFLGDADSDDKDDTETVIPGGCVIVTPNCSGVSKGNAFKKTTLKTFTVEYGASNLSFGTKTFRGLFDVIIVRVCEIGCGTCTKNNGLGDDDCTCNTRPLVPHEAGWQHTLKEASIGVEAACASSPPPQPCSQSPLPPALPYPGAPYPPQSPPSPPKRPSTAPLCADDDAKLLSDSEGRVGSCADGFATYNNVCSEDMFVEHKALNELTPAGWFITTCPATCGECQKINTTANTGILADATATSSDSQLLTYVGIALVPVCMLLIAALALLYRRTRRLSRAEANLRLSRDRAQVDLQMIVHQTQRERVQANDALSESGTEPSVERKGLPTRRSAPPSSLPPGPPSSAASQSAASQSAVEQEVAHVLLSCAGAGSQWHAESAAGACSGAIPITAPVPSAVPAYSAAPIPSAAYLLSAVPTLATIPSAAPAPSAVSWPSAIPTLSVAAAAPPKTSGSLNRSQNSPTPMQALQMACHNVLNAHTPVEVQQVVRTLGMALGASRMEVGSFKALHAVLIQLATPGMSDVEAYTLTGASRSNFMKWRRRVQNIQGGAQF